MTNENSHNVDNEVEALVAVELEPAGGGQLVPVNMGMLIAKTPAEMLMAAALIATPLKQFIRAERLFTHLGGDRPHVHVEGWTTMLAMLGVMPQEISVKEVPLPNEGATMNWGSKYVAKMALVRISDQQVVCSASSECGGVDERDWHWRPKYNWKDHPTIPGKRIKEPAGEVPVSGSQRRSMAITRATGKAARMGFSWIMRLAGYSPTPMEEFDQADHDAQADPQAPNDDPPHSANIGRNPRDDMGGRGNYDPGGQNRDRQGTQQRAKDSTDGPKRGSNSNPNNSQNDTKTGQNEQKKLVKVMNSRFPFTCEICEKDGEKDELIAYEWRKKDPYVAHIDCHNAKHGG